MTTAMTASGNGRALERIVQGHDAERNRIAEVGQ
jgi:hypothetical protein